MWKGDNKIKTDLTGLDVEKYASLKLRQPKNPTKHLKTKPKKYNIKEL